MKTSIRHLPACCAVLLLASCQSPAPVIATNPAAPPSHSHSSSSHTSVASAPPVSTSTTRTAYAYPDIAGVWKSDYGTITLGRSSGGPFPVTITMKGGKTHQSTAYWGQPHHKHFKFTRSNGNEAVATLDSLTPSTITMREENGRVHSWRKVSSL